MDEVLSRSRVSELPPDAFTTQQFMARHGLKRTAALRVLHQQEEDGFLSTRIGPLDGRSRVRVWWRNLT